MAYEISGLGNRHVNHLRSRSAGTELREDLKVVECGIEVSEAAETSVSAEADSGSPLITQCTPSNPPNVPTLRRSSRTTRKPAWAGDYVEK